MIRSLSMEVDMAATALGPEPDPLKVLTIAADKIKLLPFSFLGTGPTRSAFIILRYAL